VATFLGTANLWEATVRSIGPDGLTCAVGEHLMSVAKSEWDPAAGEVVRVMARPERVEVAPEPPGGIGAAATPDRGNRLSGRVTAVTFRGAHTAVVVDCAGLAVQADLPNVLGEPPLWLAVGAPVVTSVAPSALRLLPT
jgi:ABC-type Fe3+/spermidine/putrescine transport system ATPase subunit